MMVVVMIQHGVWVNNTNLEIIHTTTQIIDTLIHFCKIKSIKLINTVCMHVLYVHMLGRCWMLEKNCIFT